MCVTESGIVTLDNELHLKKAPPPMWLTELGMVAFAISDMGHRVGNVGCRPLIAAVEGRITNLDHRIKDGHLSQVGEIFKNSEFNLSHIVWELNGNQGSLQVNLRCRIPTGFKNGTFVGASHCVLFEEHHHV